MQNPRKFSDYIPIFQIDMNDVIKTIMENKEVQESIIELNQQQLQAGIDSNGQKIETIASQEQNSGYPYSRYTVKLRGEKGLQVDNVDLRDTGALYNSMEVTVNNEGSIVTADMDKKDGNLMDNFQDKFDFWGLTDSNKKDFAAWIFSDFLGLELKRRVKR